MNEPQLVRTEAVRVGRIYGLRLDLDYETATVILQQHDILGAACLADEGHVLHWDDAVKLPRLLFLLPRMQRLWRVLLGRSQISNRVRCIVAEELLVELGDGQIDEHALVLRPRRVRIFLEVLFGHGIVELILLQFLISLVRHFTRLGFFNFSNILRLYLICSRSLVLVKSREFGMIPTYISIDMLDCEAITFLDLSVIRLNCCLVLLVQAAIFSVLRLRH